MGGIQDIKYYKIAYENSDLDREINSFLSDGNLDKLDNNNLLEILEINIRRGLEKRILINTEKSNLLRVFHARGITEQVRKKLRTVLFPNFKFDNNKSEEVNSIRYGYTVLREEGKILGKEKIKYIQSALGFTGEDGIDGLFGKNTFVKYIEKNYFWNNESLSDFYNNYKNIYTQVEKLDNSDIRKIQSNIGASVDGIFGMETYSLIRKYYENNNVNKIFPILNINAIEDSSGGFDTIDDIEEMKKFLKSDNITEKDVERWILKGRKVIRVWTESGTRAEYVDPKELRKMYKNINNAGNYSFASNNVGTKGYRGKVNYKGMSNYGMKEGGNLEKKSLSKLLSVADKYMGAREKGKNSLSKDLRKKILNFGLDINKPKDYWCAAFIGQVLLESGYVRDVKGLKRKVGNTNRAANYLGGKDFPGHIGIKKGNMMINGNSRNSVRLSPLGVKTMNKFVGWIMPEDVGNKSKVHKSKKNIPDGAVMVFYRGGNPKWS